MKSISFNYICLFVFALSVLLFPTLFVVKVSAASQNVVTGVRFLDADQIRVDFDNGRHTLLRDNDTNDPSLEYTAASNDHSCYGKAWLEDYAGNPVGTSTDGNDNLLEFMLEEQGRPTTLKIYADIDYPGTCENIGRGGEILEYTASNARNALNYFRFEDTGTIVRVDNAGDQVYERSKEHPTLYFRTSDAGQSSCNDFIEIRANNTYRLFDISSGGGGGSVPSGVPAQAEGCNFNDNKDDGNHIYGYLDEHASYTDFLLTLGNTGQAPADPNVVAAGEADDIGSAADEEDDTCATQGGSLGWILCPLVTGLGEGLGWVDEQLIGLLTIDTDEIFGDGKVEGAWKVMRTFAYSLLIPIMLVMVVSTALGFDFISAYTVKTALPRMVIATIFIALSFSIMVFLVTMVQDIGNGIQNIILNPFGMTANTTLNEIVEPSGGALAANYGGGIAGVLILNAATVGGGVGPTLMAIVGLIGSAALMMLLVFVLLLFRQTIIVFLVIISPLAILPWIFPGRDKMFSIWNKTFWLMLAFFPAVMAAIAVGKGMAGTLLGP